jgi:hypothetical protein
MARYLKNTQLRGGSYSVQLPLGTNTLGPDSPVNGLIRYNQSNSKIEFYYNNKWNQVAKIGAVNIVKDTFTTVDGQTTYGPMSYTYTSGQEADVVVFVGGVHQDPVTNYQFDGSANISINPSTGGTANQTIVIVHNLNSTDAA